MKNYRNKVWTSVLYGVFSFALIWSLSGCFRTHSVRRPWKSGFLGDYSQLKKNVHENWERAYLNPTLDLSNYDKLLIEPVTIWRGKRSRLKDVPRDELNEIGRYMYVKSKTGERSHKTT